MNLNIAIDGPAGSGKSTIAKIVAKKYNIIYINTGAMYRGVTLFALNNDIEPDNIAQLSKLLDTIEMHFEDDRLIVNGKDVSEEITMPYISNNVSNYAKIPEVREKLVTLQQKMSKKFSVIMDGRDIGTVVLKDAKYKFFLTAKAEERAKRRYAELMEKDIEVDFNEILSEIEKRDYIDSHRALNPLKKAEDAIEIDSSHLTIDEVVNKICSIVDGV